MTQPPNRRSAGVGADVREVPKELGGTPLDGIVRALFETSWGKARAYIETGKISVDGGVTTDAERRVRAGAKVTLTMAAPRPRKGAYLDASAVVHVDPHVVVVDKPSGISTIPYDEKETGTLDELVRDFIESSARASSRSPRGQRPPLGVVHRIDKETSGLVVFTRTWLAKQSLTSQFRAHTVHRRYVAIVHGRAESRTFRTHIIENRGDGLRGSIEMKTGRKRTGPEGQLAITHVEVIERLNGATLVSCQLETGRTHQIRIHLAEIGHPLVGERVYSRGFLGPEIPAPRLMLHAAELGFTHPATEAPVRWERDAPRDLAETLARLRVGATG